MEGVDMIAESTSAPYPLRVLVVMHVENEGPGLFGELLRAAGAEVQTARLHLGEPLPPVGEVDAALSLGGPMNVYEEAEHPFLRDETRFLAEAADRGLPVLGICLGAQMIAKAAGAAVTKNAVQELGWGMVSLTEAGAADPLFSGLPEILPVFQWHGDTFAIPDGGALLATGSACRNQALRHRNSWGLQFHLEADRALLASWFSGTLHEREILRRHEELGPEVARQARTLFSNFLGFAEAARAGR
jgi:GMP synthase-like glutamine amidotransferase